MQVGKNLKNLRYPGDVEQELGFKAGCTTAMGWNLKFVKT